MTTRHSDRDRDDDGPELGTGGDPDGVTDGEPGRDTDGEPGRDTYEEYDLGGTTVAMIADSREAHAWIQSDVTLVVEP